MNENVLKALKDARGKAKKRNFSQTFDLIVNVKLLDLKKPENRFSETFTLPSGRGKGKEANVVIFSDSVKDKNLKIYKSSDIEKLGSNKRSLKKLAKETDFFLSEPKLMPMVGKSLGRILAPRGKMPSVIAGDFKQMVSRYKNSVSLKMKDSPVIQCMVGNESMADEDISENIVAVLKFLEKRLPKGRNNIGKVMVKLTMGKPVKIGV
jgi:large subunit ribosomal protein L1